MIKNIGRSRWIAALFALTLTTATQGIAAETGTLINGAGATFPYPLYSKWFSEYQKVKPDVEINYQSIGSGGGIRNFLENTVDFGATDSPMTEEQLSKAKTPVLHIPTVMGAVVLTYNLPGVGKGLKLTSDLIAGIFLEKVTKWNDPQIAQLNPGMKLPESAIIVVRRSDGSGTTGIFTDYLAKVSKEWKEKVGQGSSVNWPTGLGGKGNEGVAGLVKQTPGSIGYVELIYAENNGLQYAAVKNKAGAYADPSMKAVSAAAAKTVKNMPADFRVSITDADGKDSYPISGFTYLLVYQTMPKEKGQKLVQFLKWAMKEGQTMAAPLHYAPLPKELIKKVDAKINTIQLN